MSIKMTKKGDPSVDRMKIFHCDYCGAEWEASQENWKRDPGNLERFLCECPTCMLAEYSMRYALEKEQTVAMKYARERQENRAKRNGR